MTKEENKALKKLVKKLRKEWRSSDSGLKFSEWLVMRIAENFEMHML
jgi:hypothetical protein